VIVPRLTNLYPAVLVAFSANRQIIDMPVSAVLDTKVLAVQNLVQLIPMAGIVEKHVDIVHRMLHVTREVVYV